MVATTSRVHVEHDVTVTVSNMRQIQKKYDLLPSMKTPKILLMERLGLSSWGFGSLSPLLYQVFYIQTVVFFGIYDTIKSASFHPCFYASLRIDAISSGVVGDDALEIMKSYCNY